MSRILFHINCLERGGAERVVSVLSDYLANKDNEIIIATQWQGEDEYTLNPKVKRVSVGISGSEENKSRLMKIFMRLFRLRKCIEREKPDIVISFCAKANFRSAFCMTGMKIPLLVSVRNNPVEDYANHRLSKWYMEKKAKGCVFQTPDARDFFSERLRKRSRIIYNPLSEAFIEKVGVNAENKTISGDLTIREIVSVGRISSQKNHMLLIKAYHRICGKYPETILKIYGKKQEEQAYNEITAYINKNNLNNRVFLMGQTDNVQDKISGAVLFVLSSDYEGMPNALIEAMVLGLPVISTDCPCGGSRMLIEDGVNGKLVAVNDVEKMAQTMDYMLDLQNHSEAAEMGKRARGIMDLVNPQKVCSQWEDYIRDLIND